HARSSKLGSELYEKYVTDNAETSQALTPIINDFRNKALKGEISNFDTEWSHYIEQLYAAGLEKMIKDFYNNSDFIAYDPGDKFTLRGRP
ncbi:MAG TPA: hypothetical protein DDZ89_16575, partial [Clostridiales bacterium]|nr:hypothetical protein [Clostridiales bacterium]